MSEEENSKSGHTKREGSFCLVFLQKIVFTILQTEKNGAKKD